MYKKEIKELLGRDKETIRILDQTFGENKWPALNTVEKRAVWRFGYEHPEVKSCKFIYADTPKEKSIPLRLLHPRQLTENDAFYITLGQCAPRGKEKIEEEREL